MCFSTVVGNELSAATIGNNKPNFILTTSHNDIYRENHTEVAEYLGVTYRHLLAVFGKEDLILTFGLSLYFRKPHGKLSPVSLQLYNLGGDPVAEGFIMLYEKDRGLVGQKQLLDLHSGDYVNIIHRLVPDMKMLGLTDGAGQQDFLFLPGA